MGRVRGDHDCGFLRRIWRRGIGIACAAAAVMSLTSCVPQGKAVGDTQESEPEIAHEGVQRQDIVVGVIGSVDTGLDSDVLNKPEGDKIIKGIVLTVSVPVKHNTTPSQM